MKLICTLCVSKVCIFVSFLHICGPFGRTVSVGCSIAWHDFLFLFPVKKTKTTKTNNNCILHQIAFRQGAAILDAIRQGQPFCMAQQKMYSPQKSARSIVMLGAKLRSTCFTKNFTLPVYERKATS